MKTNEFLNPDESYFNRDEIYLDDLPVENLIYLNKTNTSPTPADIVRYWYEGLLLTRDMKQALISVIINKIKIDFSVIKIKEAESLIEENLKYESDNPGEYIRLLICLIRLKETYDHIEAKKYYKRTLAFFSQNENLLDNKIKLSWHQLNNDGIFETNPFILRSEALRMIETRKYNEAEEIYMQLIEMNFELPGTLCHLARAQLFSGQYKSAEESIENAWVNRETAKKYVVPRIIFFKILFALICKNDPSFWIQRMKEELVGPEACMEWFILPILDGRVSLSGEEDYEFIRALANALQSWSNVAGLEYFKRWTEN